MSRVIAPSSHDFDIKKLLEDINAGTIQLPEFQRNWTWDNDRIRALIASLTESYPMGAIMLLERNEESVKFKYRTIDGAEDTGKSPTFLILDGQQRLTSIYAAAYSAKPVGTKNDKDRAMKCYYYLDINKCLDPNADRIDAVISVPESRIIRKNFDRDIELDLSTRELEYQHEKFPLNIIFDSNAREDWADGYKEFHSNTQEYRDKYKRFRTEVLDTITGYKLPVIILDKTTPKEAVCKVFENVNTGGVVLTVFELVTASFAAEDFNLRADWEKCRDIIRGTDSSVNTDIMDDVDEVSFLTALTLYSSFMKPDTATSCKKKDVLLLSLADYKANRDSLLEGYKMARSFLLKQCVFRKRDLPYSVQIAPLAAICAAIGKDSFNKPEVMPILSRWFWCGVLGEIYGSSPDTRYVYDIEDVTAELRGERSLNRTVNASFFQASRLLTLQTRNSAAYKGIMALLYHNACRDFVNGTIMDVVKSMDETPDIHHIFPEAYCRKANLPREKWNSIVNKTPLLASSNRFIGGAAPSVYSSRVMKVASISPEEFRKRVESNFINYDAFITDDFNAYFIDRAKRLLVLIENVMGKPITDKDSEQTIGLFGESLA